MKLKDALYIASIVAGIIVFTYTTFATVQYVDSKHAEVKGDIGEIKQDLKEVKSMIIEMYKNK